MNSSNRFARYTRVFVCLFYRRTVGAIQDLPSASRARGVDQHPNAARVFQSFRTTSAFPFREIMKPARACRYPRIRTTSPINWNSPTHLYSRPGRGIRKLTWLGQGCNFPQIGSAGCSLPCTPASLRNCAFLKNLPVSNSDAQACFPLIVTQRTQTRSGRQGRPYGNLRWNWL